ncbi:transposable element Tcb1 transposase [Trichonephila clavipes]|nr:transposable element Tcb1 transposase [Trichonephila clavipes]
MPGYLEFVILYLSNQKGDDKVVPGTLQLDCLTGAMSCLLMSQDLLWGQMTSDTAPHIFKRGSVTAVRYRDEVLEPLVSLFVAAVGPTFVLMDDNARPHRADIVDDYMEREEIARMAWPAYSPDLNPIENLCDALGRVVSSLFPPPATLIERGTSLLEEWRLLNSAVVDHLIESIVRRCIRSL